VVRAAIAETEDLDRVAFEIPEGPLVDGASVTDVTHLLAELTENAVRFSPPDTAVTIRGRRDPRGGQGQLITVEDWGIGMDEADLTAANTLLAEPPEIDLSVSKRLGFHVVARLAARHGIKVVLSPTPGSGITASVALPGTLFELGPEPVGAAPAPPAAGRLTPARMPASRGPERPQPVPAPVPAPRAPLPVEHLPEEQLPAAPARSWSGWWADPQPQAAEPVPVAGPRPTPGPRTARADAGDETGDDAGNAAPARPRLRRRVPQAHLAPGLRVIPNPAEPAPAATATVATADTTPQLGAEGLSRYQANRAAARAVVDGDGDAPDGAERQVTR
jgi:hypothetical protein